jgi:hypothetical protein
MFMLLAMPAVRGMHEEVSYDSDSFPILLDNRASRCLTNSIKDFVTTPTPSRAQIKGIGGGPVPATFKGTVKWSFEDDY